MPFPARPRRCQASNVLSTLLHLAFVVTTSGAFGYAQSTNYTAPTIDLSYGSFLGAYSSEYNITYFRKIPFATPPTGVNRFRAPQPVERITNGTYDTDQSFDACPQQTSSGVTGSEDCLYLGLYSRPWDVDARVPVKRPVQIFFFGGGYIEGGGSFGLPPGNYPTLNVSTENDFLTILPNYRVNAFGFLSGSAVEEDPHSDSNAGLLDQNAVLRWVKQNIQAFGGDPEQVTIWGASAGAGSVVAQAISSPKYGKGLFQRAIASSPFWSKTYQASGPETNAIFDAFAEMANCSSAHRYTSPSAQLACLKAADVETLRTAALAIAASHTYNTSSYTWGPVVGDAFLPRSLTEVTATRGETNIEFGWGMYNLHEGENFIPPGFANATGTSAPGNTFNSSVASFEGWVRGFLPDMTDAHIAELITKYYPPTGTAELLDGGYNTTYVRAGLLFRDVTLACPTYFLATSSRNAGSVGEYAIPPATHGADVYYWAVVDSVQQTDPLTFLGEAGAFASFIQTGDPNAHKLTSASEARVPEVGSGEEFGIVVGAQEAVAAGELERRCAFWRKVAAEVPF